MAWWCGRPAVAEAEWCLGGHGMALGVAGNGSRMGWQAVSGGRQWQESSMEPEVAGSINEKAKNEMVKNVTKRFRHLYCFSGRSRPVLKLWREWKGAIRVGPNAVFGGPAWLGFFSNGFSSKKGFTCLGTRKETSREKTQKNDLNQKYQKYHDLF